MADNGDQDADQQSETTPSAPTEDATTTTTTAASATITTATALSNTAVLKKEIYGLHVLREFKHECALQTCQSLDSSLTKLVREYQCVFELGIPSLGYGARSKKHLAFWSENLTHMLAFQQEFTRCAINPNIKIGVQMGIEAHDETWRRYTKYHQNFCVEPGPLLISGTAEDPIVITDGFLHARDTFRYLFPHVAHDEVLMAKLIGKEVVYPFRNLFYFARDGRICESNPNMQFVQAPVHAGGSVEDVMKLMGQAQIMDQYVIGPVECEEDDDEEKEVALTAQDDLVVSSWEEELQGGEDDAAASDEEVEEEEVLQVATLRQETSALSEQDQEEVQQDEQERLKLDLAFILSLTSTASDKVPVA